MADSNKAPPSKLTKFPSEILSDAIQKQGSEVLTRSQ